MMVPFKVRAFAAAAGFVKSTKQYPALLRESVHVKRSNNKIIDEED